MITPLVKFVNRRGFPCIESNSITGTATFVFDNYKLIQSEFSGGFWVRINQTVATGTYVFKISFDGYGVSSVGTI